MNYLEAFACDDQLHFANTTYHPFVIFGEPSGERLFTATSMCGLETVSRSQPDSLIECVILHAATQTRACQVRVLISSDVIGR